MGAKASTQNPPPRARTASSPAGSVQDSPGAAGPSGSANSNGANPLGAFALFQSSAYSASDPSLGRLRRANGQPISIPGTSSSNSTSSARVHGVGVVTNGIVNGSRMAGLSIDGISGLPQFLQDSDSSPDEGPVLSRIFQSHGTSSQSLPVHLVALNGLKCPVCSKFIPSDDIECHLVMCLTKPRISYNEDRLQEDKGECVICFEELEKGNTIARLPCLCIYHKRCIDKWFEVNRSCPEHPND